MKKNPIPPLTCICFLCLFFCSVSNYNSRVYAGTYDRLSFDGKDTVDYDRGTVNDDDTVHLQRGLSYFGGIKGSIYNAVNPKYIANPYGVTVLSLYNGRPTTVFELIGLNTKYDYLTATNAAKTWNYIVDDFDMTGDKRAVVSALMLDAVEKVEFSTSPRYKHVIITNTVKDTLLHAIGDVRIRTRRVPKESVETRGTRYLLDDVEITHKIFNALNPVYIRTLERITDKKEIAGYGYENCIEIVHIDLFTFDEVVAPERFVVNSEADPREYAAIIDGVPMNQNVIEKLYYHCFKEFVYRLSEDDEAYARYVKKYPGKKYFTIISL